MSVIDREPIRSEAEVLIAGVDPILAYESLIPDELHTYWAYFNELGGQQVETPFDAIGHRMLARTYNPLHKSATIYPVDPVEPLEAKVVQCTTLEEILKLNPKNPHFWHRIADSQGKISEAIYYQNGPEPDENGIVWVGEEASYPIGSADVKVINGRVQLLFFRPMFGSIHWPQDVARDVFVFPHIPSVIDRAFRIYAGECKRRGLELFTDGSASHYAYKYPSSQKNRIAIEYDIESPNRMEVKMINV